MQPSSLNESDTHLVEPDGEQPASTGSQKLSSVPGKRVESMQHLLERINWQHGTRNMATISDEKRSGGNDELMKFK